MKQDTDVDRFIANGTPVVSQKKFEYKNMKANSINELNSLGSEGWEIINVDQGWAMLKREY